MEEAIARSYGNNVKRMYSYVLLCMNLLGVFGCLVTTIILTLWSLYLIFPEPTSAQIILDYIESEKAKNQLGEVANRDIITNV